MTIPEHLNKRLPFTVLSDVAKIARSLALHDSVHRVPDLCLGGAGEYAAIPEVQANARRLFLYTLWRLSPQTTSVLLHNAPPLALTKEWMTGDLLADARRLPQALDAHVSQWQDRYDLHDPWISGAARTTLEMVGGRDYSGPLLLFAPDAHVWIPTATPIVINGDDLGTFDPRNETLSAACHRLLPELEARLKESLQAVVDNDRALKAAQAPVMYRTDKAFEWLVRYQVLGESRGSIARSLAGKRLAREPHWDYRPDVYKSHVGKEIKRIADQCGLTLREP